MAEAMRELQEIVDDLAELLGRPITVEDRRWRLVAYSAHHDGVDEVRRRSIMLRHSDRDVVTFLDSLHLDRAEDPVEVPANARLAMSPRTCVPLRHGDQLLGYLWVLGGDAAVGADARSSLVHLSATAAEALWARRQADDHHRSERATHLDDLLHGRNEDDAIEQLSAEAGWPRTGRFVAAVALGSEDLGEHARRRWGHGELLLGSWHGKLLVIGQLPSVTEPSVLATHMRDAGAEFAAAGPVFGSLAYLRDGANGAHVALFAARADPALGTATARDDIGAWGPIVELWLQADRPGPPPEITRLEAHRGGADLLEALEATLESGGDIAAAADALHMHRATLYRRIQRVRDLTGIDVHRGDDRLLAHLGLRMRRLSLLDHEIRDSGTLDTEHRTE